VRQLAALLIILAAAACGGRTPATAASPLPSVSPFVRASPAVAGISGTWVLEQARSAGELQSPAIDTALKTPGIRGFSLRVAWSDIDGGTALLDAGLKVANAHHVAFSIRFMAGRWTPARVFAAGSPFYTVQGQKVPTPYNADGSPNRVFEKAYADELEALDGWCHQNAVHLLHLPWYGQEYAELNHGVEVRSQRGYSYQNWLRAHEDLVDIAARHMSPDLAVEFPLTG
jgi:hypothetical protein